MSFIRIINARQHNLKNISCSIPKNSLVVFTGPSGSGKSTLAMDVLYAEGQRRYIDSLPSYARQFLGIPDKPDVDALYGLCPAIAIDQKTASSSSRSTVGTVTEIYEYLRVIYATIGTPACTNCGEPILPAPPSQVTELIFSSQEKKDILITAPLLNNQKGDPLIILTSYIKQGYKRFFIEGSLTILRTVNDLSSLALPKSKRHSIDLVLEELHVQEKERALMVEAVIKAFELSGGTCKIYTPAGIQTYTSNRACIKCCTSFPPVDARLFSFNSPLGACPQCKGLGSLWAHSVEEEDTLVMPSCPSCHGSRLNIYARSVFIENKNIYHASCMSIDELLPFMQKVEKNLSQELKGITHRLFHEFFARLTFLNDVGLSYLTLARASATLSGGEAQRIRLATQIGSGLSGVLYVLDEPSIGLHQQDNDRLIATLKHLRDLGNTVVVVEHDRDTMLNADYILDIGPGAGKHGGIIVAEGNPDAILSNPHSVTGAYLAHRLSLLRCTPTRVPSHFLRLKNAELHNLKNLTVDFPLDVLCGVSGISGSGKSSLVLGELVQECKRALGRAGSEKLEGFSHLREMVIIDQKPIGRTPRSNPATYLGIFDYIRQLYSSLPESKARGYTPGTFSFNVGTGRCQTCSGQGKRTISMHLLPDVTVTCQACEGTGYTRTVLEIQYKNKHIADILKMTVEEAVEFFQNHKTIVRKIRMLADVGLGYLTLGQSADTLSGGESQRIKLAYELAKYSNKTLYILDEPTTGLHFQDIQKLLQVLENLVKKGNSIILIEHNIEVLAYMDYLIDMGPEGGRGGGQIVATGTPEEIAENRASKTGPYLKTYFKESRTLSPH